MPPNRNRSPARLLAPVALLVFALAVSLVVLGSGGTDDASRKKAGNAEQRTTKTGRTRVPARPKKRPTYTVKTGDTLGRIAEQTGVEVELLQELNPAVDPQALVAGQKIQLRE